MDNILTREKFYQYWESFTSTFENALVWWEYNSSILSLFRKPPSVKSDYTTVGTNVQIHRHDLGYLLVGNDHIFIVLKPGDATNYSKYYERAETILEKHIAADATNTKFLISYVSAFDQVDFQDKTYQIALVLFISTHL